MPKDFFSFGRDKGDEFDEYVVKKENESSKFNRCDVCDKDIHVEVLGGNYGGKCRICQRLCCNQHIKDGLCPFCREKMGRK